jgi:hypothetical protein
MDAPGKKKERDSPVDGEKMVRQEEWYEGNIMIKTVLLKCGYPHVHPRNP